MQARLEAGPGALVLGPGQRLPLAGLAATVEGSSRALTIREAVLRLPGQAGQPGPSLTAQGEVLQRDGAWRAALDLGSRAAPGQHPADALAGGAGAGGARLGAAHPALGPAAGCAGRGSTSRSRPGWTRWCWKAPGSALGLARAVFDLGQGRQAAVETAELAASYAPGLLRLDRLLLRPPRRPRPGSARPAAARRRP